MTSSNNAMFTVVHLIHKLDAIIDSKKNQAHYEEYMRQLQIAITEYFEARKNEPPPTLGVNVSDPLGLEDKFG